MDIAEEFREFSRKRHPPGSGAPASYSTALDMVDRALESAGRLPFPEGSVWKVRDAARLAGLHRFVKQEQRRIDGGVFRDEPSGSYWRNGFCSAAVKEFAAFLILTGRRRRMLEAARTARDGRELSGRLDAMRLPWSPMLVADGAEAATPEGRTALREVETRQNQDVFREIVLDDYHRRCCLTGLPVPEILRASHISPWASDPPNRLNPENGLCLSATYDAAFDRHLISFDEDYRLVLSDALDGYCGDKAFKTFFLDLKGRRMTLPARFPPSRELLAAHRRLMIART